jgi:hypothetical protein
VNTATKITELPLGQTLAVFDYPLAANLGLQEDVRLVGEFGVQLNRAFGASDTLVYIPFMISVNPNSPQAGNQIPPAFVPVKTAAQINS